MDKIQKIKYAGYVCSVLSLVATIYLVNLVLRLTNMNILIVYLVSFIVGGFIQFIIYTMTSALFSMTLYNEETKAKYWLLGFAVICLLIDFAFSLGGIFVVTYNGFINLILPIQILLFILMVLLAAFITLGNELLDLYAQLLNTPVTKIEKTLDQPKTTLSRNRY